MQGDLKILFARLNYYMYMLRAFELAISFILIFICCEQNIVYVYMCVNCFSIFNFYRLKHFLAFSTSIEALSQFSTKLSSKDPWMIGILWILFVWTNIWIFPWPPPFPIPNDFFFIWCQKMLLIRKLFHPIKLFLYGVNICLMTTLWQQYAFLKLILNYFIE